MSRPTAEYRREWRARNIERVREYARTWKRAKYKSDPEPDSREILGAAIRYLEVSHA